MPCNRSRVRGFSWGKGGEVEADRWQSYDGREKDGAQRRKEREEEGREGGREGKREEGRKGKEEGRE